MYAKYEYSHEVGKVETMSNHDHLLLQVRF